MDFYVSHRSILGIFRVTLEVILSNLNLLVYIFMYTIVVTVAELIQRIFLAAHHFKGVLQYSALFWLSPSTFFLLYDIVSPPTRSITWGTQGTTGLPKGTVVLF